VEMEKFQKGLEAKIGRNRLWEERCPVALISIVWCHWYLGSSGDSSLTAACQAHDDATPINYVSCWVRFSGHWPYNQLSMGPHVTAVSRSCFCQLHQLRVVRRSVTEDALRSLVQAFIHCWLDYCNALLAGIASTQVKRLQSVQNSAARV